MPFQTNNTRQTVLKMPAKIPDINICRGLKNLLVKGLSDEL